MTDPTDTKPTAPTPDAARATRVRRGPRGLERARARGERLAGQRAALGAPVGARSSVAAASTDAGASSAPAPAPRAPRGPFVAGEVLERIATGERVTARDVRAFPLVGVEEANGRRTVGRASDFRRPSP